MVKLYDSATGALIGTISEEQLQVLVGVLRTALGDREDMDIRWQTA